MLRLQPLYRISSTCCRKPTLFRYGTNVNTTRNCQTNQTKVDEKLLDFDNTQQAHSFKSNTELFRAAVVFSLCNIKPIVKYCEQLLNLSTVCFFLCFNWRIGILLCSLIILVNLFFPTL